MAQVINNCAVCGRAVSTIDLKAICEGICEEEPGTIEFSDFYVVCRPCGAASRRFYEEMIAGAV